MLIDGVKIAEAIYNDLTKKVKNLPFIPVFADLVVGEDPVSMQYVGVKQKVAQRIGVEFIVSKLPADSDVNKIINELERLSHLAKVSGIIVQLPLPKGIDTSLVLSALPIGLDVDVVSSQGSELFYSNNNFILTPPTAAAVMEILNSTGVALEKKNILVIGKGQLVGRPVARLLELRGLPYTVLDTSSENPNEKIKEADVIISGTGKPKFITGEMIKQGAIVIDAGTAESAGQIVGDIDTDSVSKVASFVSPVPGGVGPVTVAMLYKNVLKVAGGS